MTAWRSTPGSAAERCARRALINSLYGSVDTFAAAETQPGGLAPPLPCRYDLLDGIEERTVAAVEPISGESQSLAPRNRHRRRFGSRQSALPKPDTSELPSRAQ
jgi:hypothetical protein